MVKLLKQGDKLVNADGDIAIVIKVDSTFIYYVTERLNVWKFKINDKEITGGFEVIEASYHPKKDAEFY